MTETVRIDVTVQSKLLDEARKLAGIEDRSQLIAEALVALIERESARRLAQMGGSEPGLQAGPRRSF